MKRPRIRRNTPGRPRKRTQPWVPRRVPIGYYVSLPKRKAKEAKP